MRTESCMFYVLGITSVSVVKCVHIKGISLSQQGKLILSVLRRRF